MSTRTKPRIMMISTHGYVSANPEFGKPDTGGQVVYVLELVRSAWPGWATTSTSSHGSFEDQPADEKVADRVPHAALPVRRQGVHPQGDALRRPSPSGSRTSRRSSRRRAATTRSSTATTGTPAWPDRRWPTAWRFRTSTRRIPSAPGSATTWTATPEELERKYNFRTRIREEKVIYDECDVLIATTPQQRDILAAGEYDVPPEKIRVIPPGYDDTRFFPVSLASREALKQELELDGPIVLALGRMAKNKGYDLLLRAMPTVFERVARRPAAAGGRLDRTQRERPSRSTN